MPRESAAEAKLGLTANGIRLAKEQCLLDTRLLELAEKKAELIAKADVRAAWSRIVVAIKAGILRLPDRCTPELAATTTALEAREILQRECEAILRGLHDDIAPQ